MTAPGKHVVTAVMILWGITQSLSGTRPYRLAFVGRLAASITTRTGLPGRWRVPHVQAGLGDAVGVGAKRLVVVKDRVRVGIVWIGQREREAVDCVDALA
jgi:hypothetical protein